ncbi:HdeD family acid-resistance protein [Allobaculum mucilyticum]|uniref:HdeD family acid-resistance protein n=1 Tax=Allobaculum mucilyticum TaxID=2834459 RepID=UPI001E4BA120|nr:DUF308 domain-containing protein [Allobaculum mucilyticum]UNT97241.1 DUF308 domain-containing protein [Allobaculum mucilyticum]
MSKSDFGWYRILFIILAILYIISGFMLIAYPSLFAGSMIYMIGFLCILYGCILVASYFMAVNFKSGFTLVTGGLLILAGVLISTNIFSASIALGVVTAIGFMLVGTFKIYQSIFVKNLGISSWWTVLVLGICNLIIGLILIFNLNDSGALITVLIGTNLIVNGVSDLMLGFTAF